MARRLRRLTRRLGDLYRSAHSGCLGTYSYEVGVVPSEVTCVAPPPMTSFRFFPESLYMTAPGLFGDALRLSCNTRAASRSAPAAHHWPGPPHTSWGHLIPGRHLRKSDCLDLTICPLLRPVQSTYSDRPAQPGPGSETCHSSSALPTASSSVHTTSRPTQPAFVQPDTPPYRRPGLMLSGSRLRCHQGADSEPRQSPAREPAAARRKRVPDRGERLVPTLASLPSHYRKACTHGRDTVAKADNFFRPSKKPPPSHRPDQAGLLPLGRST